MGRSHRRITSCVALTIGVAVLTLPGGSTASAQGRLAGTSAVPSRAGDVPADFRANSLDWLDPKQGWVMGTATCGSRACTDVITTTDAGATWALVGRVPAPISVVGEPEGAGVTDIRLVDADTGWAFGPKLFQTTNGGASWTKATIPGGGRQVLSLAASPAGAFAVVSQCRYASGPCKHPLSLWRTTTPTGNTWAEVDVDLPTSFAANVSAFGSTVYVIDELADGTTPDRLYASTDGVTFSARPVPCNNDQDVGLIQAVPTSADDVAMLCDGPIGFGQAFKKVYRSSTTGESYRSAGVMGTDGIQAQLAASPTGHLAVAASANGSFIYVNRHRRTWTMPVGFGDGGSGWNDIVYTTNRTAWVVYAPAGFFHGMGLLYVTHDGGQTWTPSPFTG